MSEPQAHCSKDPPPPLPRENVVVKVTAPVPIPNQQQETTTVITDYWYLWFSEDFRQFMCTLDPGWNWSYPYAQSRCLRAWKDLEQVERDAYMICSAPGFQPPTKEEAERRPQLWKLVAAVARNQDTLISDDDGMRIKIRTDLEAVVKKDEPVNTMKPSLLLKIQKFDEKRKTKPQFELFCNAFEKVVKKIVPSFELESPESKVECRKSWKGMSKMDRKAFWIRTDPNYEEPTKDIRDRFPQECKRVDIIERVGLRIGLTFEGDVDEPKRKKVRRTAPDPTPVIDDPAVIVNPLSSHSTDGNVSVPERAPDIQENPVNADHVIAENEPAPRLRLLKKPKKPKGIFIHFRMFVYRSGVDMKQFPDPHLELSSRWKALTPEEKEEFRDLWRADKIRYINENAAYMRQQAELAAAKKTKKK